jgi:hypothetical protein
MNWIAFSDSGVACANSNRAWQPAKLHYSRRSEMDSFNSVERFVASGIWEGSWDVLLLSLW